MKSKNFVARKWQEDNCPVKKEVKHITSKNHPNSNQKAQVDNGILSCKDEALVLSRVGLRLIAREMKKEAKKAEDPGIALKCLSSAETISLLARSNIKNENEFKELFLNKMNEIE